MKPDLNSFVMVDPDKCVGCRACEIACAAKHREKIIRVILLEP